MDSFENKIAVVTGGGTGMGRELVCQLIAAGAHVAMCDVSQENMDETRRLAAVGEQRLTDHLCDVSNEAQVLAFRDEVLAQHQTKHINLLFNNAGIGGGGSFVEGDRGEWERTYAVCWDGVYLGCRAFMDALVASDEGHIVNTSSVNGFWASLGTTQAHTAYAAAKFAVKGFTEALITDLRLHAPHVHCSVVMPGHIGTSIMENSSKVLGRPWGMELPDEEVAIVRERMLSAGLPVGNVPDDHIRQMLADRAEAFRTQAPTTAAAAANVILDAVRNKQWRVLVGQDARDLDRLVREAPEEAYEKSMIEKINALNHLGALI
ncbi:MAG: SDR family NAD(P)-dependent oxidoreductase [Pseudomonadales bacterium]|nr:SDR family NAD(P)-dependent oxidoreductase [Pseudomonadales bacterium]MBL6814062.1 SDR family NAD(P)-dependent oxidoreductase [Pseudomonadales bacterium]